MEEPVIPCQRCQRGGATAYRGWLILCDRCQRDDDSEWFDKGRDHGHVGDRSRPGR